MGLRRVLSRLGELDSLFFFFFGLVLRSCGMLFLLGAFCSSSSSQRWNSIVTASNYRLQSSQVGQVQNIA